MSVCRFLDRPSGGSNAVENPSSGAVVVGTKPRLVAVGSATVALLSQSSGHFLWHEAVANCALYCTNNSAVASSTV